MDNCKLHSLRGYNYKLNNSIINYGHCIEGAILMPLANSIQLFDGSKATTVFETKREINALDLRGSLLVLGERASPGQLISAVLVDLKDLDNPRAREFNYQKTKINLIALSPDGEFIVSVGSSSQGNEQLNVIEVNNQSEIGTRVFFNKPLKKKDGKAVGLKFSNSDSTCFILMCQNKVTLNHIDTHTEAVEEIDIKTSKVRHYNSFVFSPDDRFLYGCSKNGDIAEIDVQEGREVRIGPRKRVITKGITHISYIEGGYLAICGKEGFMAIVQLKQLKIIDDFKIDNEEIVSLASFRHGQTYVSTNKAVIYRFTLKKGIFQQIYTCHTTQINSIVAIKDFPNLFGTCSGGDIIIWNTQELSPILKISLPKLACLSLCLPKTGKLIISGWNDDTIRMFSPQNGKLDYKISPAALGLVKVIIADDESTRIFCGGESGVIRMWNIMPKNFGVVLGSFAFHCKAIHNLKINPWNSNILVSCSEDGTLGVWNLKTMQLLNSFFVCNYVMDAQFLSSTKIQAVGSGSIIYECLLSSGEIKKEIPLNGACINTIAHYETQFTKEHLLFFGGDTNYLQYYELNQQMVKIQSRQSYGPILKMILTSDKNNLLAVTQNGIILNYRIFGVTKKQ